MAAKRSQGQRTSRIQRAKQYLKGGGIVRDDSDDELGIVDHPWEWIYRSAGASIADKAHQKGDDGAKVKSKTTGKDEASKPIVGARMGNFSCSVGDTVLLKAEGNEAWVGLICDFLEDDEGDKMASFMWFSTPREIRNKLKRRTDALENELYITPSWDENPLTAINGKAVVVSKQEFDKRYPTGRVPRTSKDYGKIFVCRRGCNTRTATYTDEFVWEDVYGGETDIPTLIDLIKGQTKATRKRAPKATDEFRDFVAEDDEEDREPQTPRKRRRFNNVSAASTPTKSRLTPKKLLTPTHKRIVVKKPLEFTPLGTRVLPPSVLSSPHQLARSNLHVSSVPATLPCREAEFSEVYTVLERAITDGTGSCIYIAGTPGTGKTATVREVVAQLNAAVLSEELDDFVFVEINGMKVTDAHQAYSLLWEAIRGDRVSPSHALDLLNREFGAPSPRRVPVVVLMDELDQLVTKTQSVMYNFFNWPSLRHSRLIVLAVANTMDLPERTLSNKISSRLGLQRITFKGYTHHQLVTIIQSRLENVPGQVVREDAVLFAAHKVAAVSGDARRALDICRRAVEIAETEALEMDNAHNEDDSGPGTPSKSGRGKRGAKPSIHATPSAKANSAPSGTVTIEIIRRAIAEATASPLQQFLRSLPVSSKLFLAALLARMRRTGVPEVTLGDVVDEATRLAEMSQLAGVQRCLLERPLWDRQRLACDSSSGAAQGRGRRRIIPSLAAADSGSNGSNRNHGGSAETNVALSGKHGIASEGITADEDGYHATGDLEQSHGASLASLLKQVRPLENAKATRAQGLGAAAASLLEAGVIGMEARRGERVGRLRLNVGSDEVGLALREDEGVRGLGFNA